MDAQGLFTKEEQPHSTESVQSTQPKEDDFTLGEEAQPAKDEAFTLGGEEKASGRSLSDLKQPIKLTDVVPSEQPT
jgi:hypothetical protein